LNIQQEIKELTLSYFKTINSEIIEENGLYKISIPEKFQNYFETTKILMTFDEKIALEYNCELIIPGNKILFKIINNSINQGPIALKQTNSCGDNFAIRYHFFVNFSGIQQTSKLVNVDINLKTLEQINIQDKLVPSDFSLNQEIIFENVEKSYDVALEVLLQETDEMKNQFIENSNIAFDNDFQLFCSRYDSEMKELDEAINRKEQSSDSSDEIQKFRFESVKKINDLEKTKDALIGNIDEKHAIELNYELIVAEIINF
jgi:hypothetical protein